MGEQKHSKRNLRKRKDTVKDRDPVRKGAKDKKRYRLQMVTIKENLFLPMHSLEDCLQVYTQAFGLSRVIERSVP